jgi:hypothetical protein
VSQQNFLQLIEHAWLLTEEYRVKEVKQLNESLRSNRLGFLLTEQEDTGDEIVSDVNEAADKASDEVEKILSTFPSGKMENTKAALDRAKSEIASARLKQGSPIRDLVGEPIKLAMRIFTNVQILNGSIAKSLSVVKGALKDLGATEEEGMGERTIGAILDTDTAGEENVGAMPSKADFEKSIANSLEPPEGLFGGVGKFFKSAISTFWKPGGRDVGFGLTQDGFVEDILGLTMDEATSFIDRAQAPLEDAASADDDDPIQQVEDTLTDAGVDSEEELEGDAPITGGETSQSGPFSLGDDHLEQLTTAIPSGGKATGKVLNSLVGKPLFAEGIAYSRSEAFYILESFLTISCATASDRRRKNSIDKRNRERTEQRRKLLRMASVIK